MAKKKGAMRREMVVKNDAEFFKIGVVKITRHPDAFPIHRGWPLGNPFVMHDESERDKVVDQYEAYFKQKLRENDKAITTELARAVAKTIEQGYIKLGCFCFPKRCHGDIIAKYLDLNLNYPY